MKNRFRIFPVGSLALVLLAFATGMTGAAKPRSEEAYWRELSRLRAVDQPAALAFAMKGDDWYADSNAEARKAMVITLLVDTGKMDEARTRTRAFMAAFPKSPYLPIVQGVTGIHPRPHGPLSHP
jgi:hypothetical protein